MTNKEAIMILESIQPSCGEKYSFSESEIYEAIDMAIEALEAQEGKNTNVPSKDIVYRQDVEDMLQNALPSRGMWEIEGDVVKNTICETVVDLMMDLAKLPSAQPEREKGKWIVFKAPDEQHCGLVKCPFCGEDMIAEADEYSFCPNCGADMRGEQDENR